MYRKPKKIPTLLALLILFAGIGSAVYFDQSSKTFFSKAEQSSIPSNVHFTNISQSSMTISWLTSKAVTGIVEVTSPDQDKHSFLDDLDTDNISRIHTTHNISLTNLTENTLYQVKIMSGTGCQNTASCPIYQQKTSVKMDAGAVLPPANGTIRTVDGNTVEGVLVYLIVGKSLPLSGRTDSLGRFVIPLNNLRSQDLLSRPKIADNDIVQ
ncbi:fibronectin type III domain-containing protein, partial [Candidatus Gottesmanbacteria bacterium]|nr:fibronectin type III domain-containing protein [Candidatus Gottesmanbacteria bacterium]